jgi:pimeloyl-ACP methyl ester carboxylesterase
VFKIIGHDKEGERVANQRGDMDNQHNTSSFTPDAPFESYFFKSQGSYFLGDQEIKQESLLLHAKIYKAAKNSPPLSPPLSPVVCLHGLARNSTDFHTLASALTHDPIAPRDVIVPDYRGRGRSQYAQDEKTYTLAHELQDLLVLLKELKITRALFIGTSRGGLLTMGLSAMHPEMIEAAVLNDIGPVMEVEGLKRIKGYVGKLATPRDEAHAMALVKHTFAAHFPAFTDEDWQAYAHGTWHEDEGKWVLSYDPNLMLPFYELDLDAPQKPLWPLYETLKHVPLLIIRGECSDLLSPEICDEMLKRHTHSSLHTVKGQGHAPLLRDAPTLETIVTFCRAAHIQKAI